MNGYFTTSTTEQVIPIIPIVNSEFLGWIEKQSVKLKTWIRINEFKAKSATFCFVPDKNGQLKQIFLGINNQNDFWAFGILPTKLSEGTYQIQDDLTTKQLQNIAIAWGLGNYKFTVYKKSLASKAKLLISEMCDLQYIENVVSSISLVRDLINYPAEDMEPASLAKAVLSTAIEFNANVGQIIGDDLLKKGYAAIHIVGRASSHAPRLIDLKWGKEKDPKVTLVGKGVCFDSGGLDLKPRTAMEKMKSDMAGAAHALGLARMIMSANLPINLRVLIPAVENMPAGNSYKPGDIVKTYKGITVEVADTDAEGRLILADTLTVACEDNPELIINFATLTGAAHIAMGNEIAALFSNNDDVAREIIAMAEQENDPICRMPLYQPYRELLDSNIADISNVSNSRGGGAIIAALFLKEFINNEIPWVHFDFEAYNSIDKPGRPKGGEAQTLRALFQYLLKRFAESKSPVTE
jgi:leucyl aminopeptidase